MFQLAVWSSGMILAWVREVLGSIPRTALVSWKMMARIAFILGKMRWDAPAVGRTWGMGGLYVAATLQAL